MIYATVECYCFVALGYTIAFLVISCDRSIEIMKLKLSVSLVDSVLSMMFRTLTLSRRFQTVLHMYIHILYLIIALCNPVLSILVQVQHIALS